MTITAVVLGTATLGKFEVDCDCDCATDATAGSIAVRKGIMNFIVSLSIQSVSFCFNKEYDRTLISQKIYASAKDFMKKFLASVNICSRLWGSGVKRAIANTPAILGNNNLHFASFSSRV